MLRLIMRTLRLMERRNEQRFEILYAYLRMGDRVRGPKAMDDAREMSELVRQQTPIDWNVDKS